MMYPKLYMLSTLGVRKHYHQDYKLHERRTDFAGKNGIGKSILADLIQLIFIQDRSLIRFGTDGLKKEGRSIETIPYRHEQSYAYFTVQTETDKFIIIGVCIPTDSRTPLRPFIITKTVSDINRANVTEIAFSKEQIIKSSDLLVDQHVVPILELGKYVRSNYQLDLRVMKPREYHSFLNRLKLLAIDLTKDNNLKSFARIIQSFSRAKDFNLTDPNNLKNFLFEEVGEQLFKEFKLHQNALAEQLVRYKDLNDTNENISTNQRNLKKLKDFQLNLTQVESLWHQTVITEKKNKKENQEAFLKILFDEIKSMKNEFSQLKRKVERLKEHVIPLSNDMLKQAEHNYIELKGCNDLSSQYNQLLEKERQLIALNLPDLSVFTPESKEELDILETDSLVNKVKKVVSFINEFNSLSDIQSRFIDQEKILQDWLNETEKSIEQVKFVLEIIIQNKEGSLFAAILKRGTPLNISQETVLFHLINNGWKAVKSDEGNKYISNLDALNKNLIEEDLQASNMVWFKAGFLHERIELRSDSQLLGDVEAMKTAEVDAKERLENRLKTLNATRSAILNATAGNPFDTTKLPDHVDERFVSKQQLNYIEDALRQACNVSDRIKEIESAKDKLNEKLQLRLSGLPFKIGISDVLKFTQDWHNSYTIRKERHNKLESFSQIISLKLAELNGVLPLKERGYLEREHDLEKETTELNSLCEEYERFLKFVDEEGISLENVNSKLLNDHESTESNFKVALKDYRDYYAILANPYRASQSSDYSIHIDEQVKQEIFSFKALESHTLSGIGLLEEIDIYLTDLNKKRMECRRVIYDEMKGLFSKTIEKYGVYRDSIRDLNTFFKSKKVSNRFYFDVQFVNEKMVDGRSMIDWIHTLHKEKDIVFETHELELGKSVSQFIEEFHQQITKETMTRPLHDLLDPKNYFNLSIRLLDDKRNEIPGSTGEAYTSIILLGIGRLSIMSENDGLKFVLLEETASIDKENFNLVMSIAAEFGYQIITMTPEPYGVGATSEWYLHQLIPGNEDPDINHPDTASYFRRLDQSSVLENT